MSYYLTHSLLAPSPPLNVPSSSLETMQHNLSIVAYLLIHQETLHIRPLVPTQLHHLPHLLILLHRSIATKVLLERLTDPLNIQVIRQPRNGGDTLATVALLDAHVHFVGCVAGAALRVLEGVEAEVRGLGRKGEREKGGRGRGRYWMDGR